MASETAKAVVRSYFDVFHNQRREDIAEDILATDLLEPTRVATERLRAAFPDYQFTINALLAEDDVVATVWTGGGTHQGAWMSPIGVIQATGKRVTWTATTTLQVTGDKITAVIASNWDHLGILQQLDAIPLADQRPGA